MNPILVEIPLPFGLSPLPIYSYGFMMMLAFASGLVLASRRAKQAGIPAQVIMDLSLYAVVAGIIGARLTFIVSEIDTPRPLLDYFAIWHGGLTFQGGLFMALAVSIWYLVSRRLPAGLLADLFTPSLAIGVAIGRIGCFLNGCCWGTIASREWPLGMVFSGTPQTSSVCAHQLDMLHRGELVPLLERLGRGDMIAGLPANLPAPVHPTQLYTSLALLAIFAIILVVERLPRRFDGMVMLVFLMLYSLFRFTIEFIRDDTPLLFGSGPFPGLRLGQILAGLTMVVASVLFAILWKKSAAPSRRGLEENRP